MGRPGTPTVTPPAPTSSRPGTPNIPPGTPSPPTASAPAPQSSCPRIPGISPRDRHRPPGIPRPFEEEPQTPLRGRHTHPPQTLGLPCPPFLLGPPRVSLGTAGTGRGGRGAPPRFPSLLP